MVGTTLNADKNEHLLFVFKKYMVLLDAYADLRVLTSCLSKP